MKSEQSDEEYMMKKKRTTEEEQIVTFCAFLVLTFLDEKDFGD
jgi:hypothetical protein